MARLSFRRFIIVTFVNTTLFVNIYANSSEMADNTQDSMQDSANITNLPYPQNDDDTESNPLDTPYSTQDLSTLEDSPNTQETTKQDLSIIPKDDIAKNSPNEMATQPNLMQDSATTNANNTATNFNKDISSKIIDNPNSPAPNSLIKQDSPKEPSTQDDINEEIFKNLFPNNYIESAIIGFIDGLEETLLKINIRRIALDFSNTTLNVSDEYRTLEINQFSGDNSTIANIIADLALEYNFENSRLSNTLYAEYGLILLKPKYKASTKTETADTLLLNTGYTRKSIILENGFFGPFIDGEYQSEWTRKEDGSRNQYLRYKAGARFLDGKYIDELYLAGVGEIDLTYKPSNIKGAIEAGIRTKFPVSDDIKVVFQGFTRQYVGYTRYRESDLLYNINLNLRLDVSIYQGFAFSPFVSVRFAKISGANRSGNNITTGISLLYSSSINAISSIQSTQNAKLKSYFKSINE